jgi:hypothetical protein
VKTRSRVFWLPNHHRHHVSSLSPQYKLNPARFNFSTTLAASLHHLHHHHKLYSVNDCDYTFSPHLFTTRVKMSASHPHVVPDEAEDYDSDYELLDFGMFNPFATYKHFADLSHSRHWILRT